MTKLESLLNSILMDEDIECDAVESNEFAYYYSESKACYTLAKDEEMDNAFLAFARKNGLNEKVSAFVISFFHEVGHNETIDEVEEEYNGNKNALSAEEYFNLDEEWYATEWAIDFCNSHLDLVEKIQNLL